MPIYNNTKFCTLCGANNHLIPKCPRNHCPRCEIQGHIPSRCPGRICHGCGQKGHSAITCTTFLECEKCYSLKHGINRCPHRFSDQVFIRRPTNDNKRITLGIATAQSLDEQPRSDTSGISEPQPRNRRTRPIPSITSTMNDFPSMPPEGDLPIKDK